jgi:hypothetical protein
VSAERLLAAASHRLRGVPGFPRAAGRPRKHAANGHVSGQAIGDVPQPRAETRENAEADEARVCQAPIGALEQPTDTVVTVAPVLLSVARESW